MKRKIKLGDSVRLISDKTDTTGEVFLKDTIGVICDIDNPNCPIVELKNSEGKDSWTSFKIDDLELID